MYIITIPTTDDGGENIEICLPLHVPNFHRSRLEISYRYRLFIYHTIIIIYVWAYIIYFLVIFVAAVVCSRRIALNRTRRIRGEGRGEQERRDIYL